MGETITALICTYFVFGLMQTLVIYWYEGLGRKWWHVLVNAIGGVLIWPVFWYRAITGR